MCNSLYDFFVLGTKRVWARRLCAFFISLALLLALPGCSGKTRIQYRESTPEAISYDYKVTSAKPSRFRFADWTLMPEAQPALTVSVEQLQLAQRFSYQQHIKEERKDKTSDAACFIFPFLWFLLVTEPENCFSKKGEWKVVSTDRVGERRVGEPESRWQPITEHPLVLALTSFDAQSNQLEQLHFKVGVDQIGLPSRLAALEVEPAEVRVKVSTAGEVSDQIQFDIDQQTLAQLVPSPVWLPLEMAKDKYMVGLRDALIAGNQHQAISYFDKLSMLPIELPDSFYYRYAVALSQVGRLADAKRNARLYIERAGPQGEYSQAARQLL